MNRDELRGLLQQPYDRQTWQGILRDVFKHVSILSSPHPVPCAREDVESFMEIGSVRLDDGKHLSVFEIKVGEGIKLLRNRVELRNLVARHIDQQARHGVLVIFDGQTDDYRFTFAARETEFDEQGNFVERETATKRYTYMLGPNEACTTPALRFKQLAERNEAKLSDVVEAFSVERLNKEFFDAYKRHYENFVGHLLAGDIPRKVFGVTSLDDAREQDKANKPVRDFAKRLLGRIVFLYFLQKKGWLGCPTNTREWERGVPDFVGKLFADCQDKDKFHSQCLVPLFYETLNRPNRPGDLFTVTKTRVPYLNGGLFEHEPYPAEKIDFPAILFAGLLEFFGQYNFTIDENDPDDNEVGIDPEMLGHIFENLLEDNKDKGAYYTPKPIVQYMCQQSLLYYLQDKLGECEELTRLVRYKDAGGRDDKANWVRQKAKKIEELLDQLKVCDPAIGSGAFPIGILQEIYWLKLMLDWTLDPAETKLKIIQNSIYGVDIDAGAVEIARLRFWLALIVDEDQPRPLPNLDYKIIQGDSLLESFEGIPLDNLHEPDHHTVAVFPPCQTGLIAGKKSPARQGSLLSISAKEALTAKEKAAEIIAMTSRYFNETDPAQKQELHRNIDRFVLDHIDYNLRLAEERLETELHQHQVVIAENQKRLKSWKPPKKTEKRLNVLRGEIKTIQQKKAKLAKLEEKPERPYFLWHLFFQDVFALGGFDIVIGNPPYVRADNPDIAQERVAIQNEIRNGEPLYQTLWERWDLFIPFIELGYRILRKNGIVTMIVSDAYSHSKYAIKSQKWFLNNTIILRLDFLSSLQIFDAGVHNMIFFYKYGDGAENRPERRLHIDSFGNATDLKTSLQKDLDITTYFPESRKNKLFKVNTVLISVICYVSFGCRPNSNEKIAKGIFVVADLLSEKKDKNHPKPYIEAKDLDRWHYFQSRWLEWGTDRSPSLLTRPTFEELYHAKEKIMAADVSGAENRAAYDNNQVFHSHTLISFVPWHYLKGVKNRSLKKSARYRDEPNKPDLPCREELEQTSRRFNVKFLLACMNSSVARDFLRANRRSNIHLYPDDWKKLPIPDVPLERQTPIVSLVEKILTAKHSNPQADISSLDLAVDKMVADLYSVSEDQVV
jgi:hypothetical protein